MLRNFVLLLCLLSVGELSFARFFTQDADRIDQEELLGVEYYNDIISYEHPVHWDRKWNKVDTGFRLSAGSFNDKRFYLKEDIKISSSTDDVVVISFEQKRREDLLEEARERQAKIAFKQFDPIKISLFGDGDSYKKWGDVGVGLGFEISKKKFVEAYYWSVDHYYDTKEGIITDKYLKASKTHGMRFFWEQLGPLNLELKYEKDTPLIWYRESRYYIYEYARSRWFASLSLPIKQEWLIKYAFDRDIKREAKQWNVTKFTEASEGLTYAKGMDRDVSHYEASLFLQLDQQEDLKFSIQKVLREAEYSYFRGVEVLEYQISEEESFDTTRNEWMFYGTWNFPVTHAQRTQLGFHCNQVEIDNPQKPEENLEVKAQFAWEWITGSYGSVMLNTSWDIDQIARDIEGGPWGGGDIQLFLAF